MFAGFGVVGAAATHLQVAPTAREQGHTGLGEGRLQVGGHLTRQQLGSPTQASGEQQLQAAPLGFACRLAAHADPIRRGPRTLHPGLQAARLHRQIRHLAAAGIAPSPLHPRSQAITLQHGGEPLRPPLAGQGFLAFAGLPLALAGRTRRCHGLPSDGRSRINSRNSSVDRRLRAFSPLATTRSASSRLPRIKASMPSSTVPPQTNLCTCTQRN